MFVILFLPFAFLDYGCKESSTEPIDNDTSFVHVKKPNLYVYPEEIISLTVEINFPQGGEITESIPIYNSSWNVTVEPEGRINERYDYLYYECKVPEFAQYEFGWIINKQNLEDFFTDNLMMSGFNEKEVKDFIEYWIPLLNDFEYFEIYPQYKTILDQVIEINFSKEPSNFYRLCYVLKGRDDNNLLLIEPEIEFANRSGYFAAEWGVIIK